MDQLLLTHLNHSLASPFLDVVALTLSSWGLALCPALAMALLLNRQWRRAAAAMLAAQAGALAACLGFQYTILRTRPEGVRLIFAAPNFPSNPSGHAAIAFATVAVLLLVARRWWLGPPLLGMAALISLSRVYLGFHYPSDIAAGAVLGAAMGAASYGLLASRERRAAAWRWLLWPQLALVALATQLAYLNLLPRWLRAWPDLDKVLHFLLFGLVVFWLQQWLAGRRFARLGGLPVAVLVPFAAAAIDEFAQRLSPVRTFDLLDLASDLAGMLVFFGLAVAVMKRTGQERARPAALSRQPRALKH